MNVQILSVVLTAILLISGCSFLKKEKPLEIISVPVEKTKLNIEEPDPLSLKTIKWIVITPENADTVWTDLQNKKIDLVLFAITDTSYQDLSLTMIELRNYIALQRSIILKYKQYYESD